MRRRRAINPETVARLALGIVGVLIAVAPTRPIAAQGPKPMSLVDIAELPRALDPQLSPDGRVVLYSVSHADWQRNRPVWQLWRQDIGGSAPVQLTFTPNGTIPIGTRWSPDGTTILFSRDGQLSLMPARGGEARQLTKHATGVTSPTWSPDGKVVYFVAADATSSDERERNRVRDDVYEYGEDFKQRHLWKVTVATGAEQTLTSGDYSVTSYRLSRDGRHIAFIHAPTPLPGDEDRSDVWTMDADGQHAKALTSDAVAEYDPELSPDNRQVLFLANASSKLEPYYNQNLFIVSADGDGGPRALIPDFPYEFDRATWSPDGRSIIAVVNMGYHSEMFSIDAGSGKLTQLTDGHHSIPSAPAPAWNLEPSAGRLIYLLDEPSRFGDIWTMPISGGAPTRVTGIYDTLEKTYALPKQERFEWKGADGAAVDGVLFYPSDYHAGTKYPLIVQMHGGPMESDKFGSGAGLIMNYFPVLTGKGYVVLRPNYRGSSGYLNAFYRDVIGHYFNNMQGDILAAVDALIARGIADPDRLVLMGWSAGGHLTNKLITMTDRFKAASAGASAANFMSFYAQTDVRYTRTPWFGATPWQKNAPTALYWDQSPLKDVARVKTPTIFFVGENDPRVPLPQSIEMWRALRANGVPTRLYVAPRESHQWGELRHLLAKANAELEWFERYARGRDYTPEKAP
ncbi:MAG TPA: S9 family peptidase [Vicinamibacterales bacterium]|jgi:dipeptidyl aminopeptidase/acylaminoacyl peptidase